MLAEAWSAEGALPLAIDPAHHGITDVARAQLSLLAAASATLPPDVRVNCTVGHPMFTTNEIQWRQVDFRRCRINHTGQDVSFYRCAFSNCVIDLKEFASPTIVECKFDETRITFDRLPDWPDVHWILDAPQQRLGIPGYIWDLAALLDDGAEVYIGTRKWTLSWQPLSMAAEFYRRLRGKIFVRNFATGPYATQLQEFIPGLSTAQWIIVDSSREETAIELTVKARAMLAKLSTHPLDVQHEFDIFKM